jgi:hypothetical protein
MEQPLLTDEQYRELYSYVEQLVNKNGCSHTLRRARTWLQRHGAEIRPNIAKMIDLGGMCDCEVLMNVSPELWREMRDQNTSIEDIIGTGEADHFVSASMQMSLW